jgi:dipeptidyl-peptidase-3
VSLGVWLFLLFSMRLSFHIPLRSRGLGFKFSSSRITRPALATTFPLVRILQQQPRRFFNMNAQELSQYLADAPPSVVRLEIEKHFTALSDKQKRYAHFISK